MDYKRIYSIVAKIILSKTMTESQWQKYHKQHPHAKRSNHHIIPDKRRNVRHKKKNNRSIKQLLHDYYHKFNSLITPISRLLNTSAWQREKTRDEILIINGAEDVDFRKQRGINPIYKYDRKSGISSVFKPFGSLKNTHLRKSLSPIISQSEREIIAFRISDWLGLNVVPPTYLRHRNIGNTKNPTIGSEQLYIKSEDFFDTFVTSTGTGTGNIKSTQLNVRNFVNNPLYSQFQKELPVMAITDFIFGNTDRHSGNITIDSNGKLYAIDNGLCFTVDNNQDEFNSICLIILHNMAIQKTNFLAKSTLIYDKLMDYDTMKNILKEANTKGLFSGKIKNFIKHIRIDKKTIYKIFNVNTPNVSERKARKQTADALIDRLIDLKKIFS